MNTQFYQSQYILNKVFNNTNNLIKTSLNTSQDYLNAVYDNSQDSLRIAISGGMLPAVNSVQELPLTAQDGQLCPIVNTTSNVIAFYQWDKLSGQWKYRGESGSNLDISDNQVVSLKWLHQHIDQIKSFSDFDYLINIEEITLPAQNLIVQVQHKKQKIDDDLNGDNDTSTPYRIDIVGYVLSVATYANNTSLVPDRYYTRITYDSANGGLGMSHIYMQQQEYDFFSSLQEGKNILKVYYITNSKTSPVKRQKYILNADKTIIDSEGNYINVQDINDSDGNSETVCKIECPGYVLGIQNYETQNSLIPDKYYTKIVYQSDGIHAGKSYIYMDEQEYLNFANLGNNKNVFEIYYVSTVFPASVTISETQYLFPVSDVNYIAIDADGNPHNIQDVLDTDGDTSTHIKISISGFVLDVDGYYNEGQPIKKRLLVKLSYDSITDVTDIYLEKEYYDYVSALGNGKNIISIYSLGAGIGIDASRIQSVDNTLDVNSEKAIQNKAVAQAIQTLTNEINNLKNKIGQ